LKIKNNKNFKLLQRNGYCVEKNIISKKQALKFAKQIDYLNKKKTKTYHKFKGWEVVHNPFLYILPLSELIINKKILKYVNFFLPKNCNYILKTQIATNSLQDKSIKNHEFSRKISSKNKERTALDVHIDSPFPFNNIKDVPEITIMIALDNMKISNGATCYYKKSHTSGLKPNHIVFKKYKKYYPKKILEVESGSVGIAMGSTWHSVGKNTDGKRRWAIQQRYVPWYSKQMHDYSNLFRSTKFRKYLKLKIFYQLLGGNSFPPKSNSNRYDTVTKIR